MCVVGWGPLRRDAYDYDWLVLNAATSLKMSCRSRPDVTVITIAYGNCVGSLVQTVGTKRTSQWPTPPLIGSKTQWITLSCRPERSSYGCRSGRPGSKGRGFRYVRLPGFLSCNEIR